MSRSELANWASSSFEIGIGARNWNLAFDLKGGTGETSVALQRTFKLSDATSLQIGTALDPLNMPLGIALNLEATQNWRDIVPGGLSVSISVGLTFGGTLLRLKCVHFSFSPSICARLLPAQYGPRAP